MENKLTRERGKWKSPVCLTLHIIERFGFSASVLNFCIHPDISSMILYQCRILMLLIINLVIIARFPQKKKKKIITLVWLYKNFMQRKIRPFWRNLCLLKTIVHDSNTFQPTSLHGTERIQLTAPHSGGRCSDLL